MSFRQQKWRLYRRSGIHDGSDHSQVFTAADGCILIVEDRTKAIAILF